LEDIDNPVVFTIDGKRKYGPHKIIRNNCGCISASVCGKPKPAVGTPSAEVEPSSHIGLIGISADHYGKPRGKHLSGPIKIALELVLIAILVD